MQLDFLVACVFLSAVEHRRLAGRPADLGRPRAGCCWPWRCWGCCSARLFYLAATENYVAFGELVRSSIDLYRFELVDALRVARPRSLRDERALWHALQRVSAAGQEGIDLSYRHQDPAEGPQP